MYCTYIDSKFQHFFLFPLHTCIRKGANATAQFLLDTRKILNNVCIVSSIYIFIVYVYVGVDIYIFAPCAYTVQYTVKK